MANILKKIVEWFTGYEQTAVLDYFTEEERKIFYEAGCLGADTILTGAKKLIAEIKRLKQYNTFLNEQDKKLAVAIVLTKEEYLLEGSELIKLIEHKLHMARCSLYEGIEERKKKGKVSG